MEKTASKYLQYLNIPISKLYLQKLIASHPNYPSILSISDVLHRFGIDHVVATVKERDLEKMPFPYLLQINKDGGKLALIKNQNDYLSHRDDFHVWGGIILRAEQTKMIADEENKKQLLEEKFQFFTRAVFLTAIGALLVLATIQMLSWLFTLLLITSLLGAITGYLLIAKDIGINYQMLEALCSTSAGSNCEKILKSDGAKLFGKISFSDAGVIYFSFQFFILGLFAPLLKPSTTFLFALMAMSLLTIPVIIISIYYQGVKVKTWCKLCLIVDGILLIQLILFTYMFSQGLILPSIEDIGSLGLFGILFFIMCALILSAKYLLAKAQRSFSGEVIANRTKYSTEVFLNQLYKTNRVDTTPFKQEILLGRRNAPIRIVMAASLSCKPCGDEFTKAAQIISMFNSKVNLSIRFRFMLISENNPNPTIENMYFFTYWLLKIRGKKNEQFILNKLIHKWYSVLDPNKFSKIYPLPDKINLKKIWGIAYQHTNWFESAKINQTPTFFINGYKMPTNYNVDDLKMMMPALIHHADDNIHYKQQKA